MRIYRKTVIGQFRVAPLLSAVAFILVVLTGCGPVSPNQTPIVVFPSPIPGGTKLPTFGAPVVVPPTLTPVPTTIVAQPTAAIPTRVPTIPPPTAIPTLDNNWTPLSNGVEWRRLTFNAASTGQLVGVIVVRINPTLVTFKVQFTRGQARSIQDWALASPRAIAIMNGNYFDKSYNPIGLVGTDSVLYGASVSRNDGGMFQVVGGQARIRSLWLEKFSNTERFDQALQGFPMLMVKGQVPPAFFGDLSPNPDLRTVIAQDIQGRIIFIVTPFSIVTLMDMAKWLNVSGLQIDSALNLDGGTSSSLYMATGGPSQYTGFKPVPIVVAVYPR